MKKITIKSMIVAAMLMFGLIAISPLSSDANAIGIQGGANSAKGSDQSGCLFDTGGGCEDGGTPIFQTITNVLLFIIGAVSVIMLIIGGIRYTVSGGDSGAVTSAKNTILYAIIGIIVAILAYALVNFVIGSFVGNNGG